LGTGHADTTGKRILAVLLFGNSVQRPGAFFRRGMLNFDYLSMDLMSFMDIGLEACVTFSHANQGVWSEGLCNRGSGRWTLGSIASFIIVQ
jgi:hypothetical protein